ncbi:beta-galactosidase [Niabella aquatica]
MSVSAQYPGNLSFETGNKVFLLNGKPFVVRAAELHYPRIPKEYWEHRIQLCKAMGMNTICIYLFWNIHEQKQGSFDFTGQNDIAAFVQLVQKNGMYCIVRPGPYVCAEWDMGGLPWWLLKKDDLKVRTRDDSFYMQSVRNYLRQVGKILSPYQIQNGGNIIMVQVENEYGTWGNDGLYMTQLRDVLRTSGFDKVQLFRCDWSSNFNNYNVEGVAGTLNFGAGANIEEQFRRFQEVNPTAPLMCSEYWTGWFDAWGRPHQARDVKSFIGSLKDMMERRISFSLYMAHGGTSFGQWAGANTPPYAPDVSSYDYNAPIDEGGNPTEKFYAIRELLKNHLNPGETLAPVPAMPVKTITIPEIRFKETAGLFENLPPAKQVTGIKTMEYFNQGWGSILYRTKLKACSVRQKLIITDVHDYAMIFINQQLAGKIDRRIKGNEITISPVNEGDVLDILIDTEGRVNYGEGILDRKGITKSVELFDGIKRVELNNWSVCNLPVDYQFQSNKNYQQKAISGTGWYKATFELKTTGDTYLDMSTWGKGMVWVNGHNLGRYWNIGPVQTLYLPGCWLHRGKNEIVVLDIEKTASPVINGVAKPILDRIKPDATALHRKPGQQLDLSNQQPVFTGILPKGNGWKEIRFNNTFCGRYFCIEAVSPQTPGDKVAGLAEIEILGEDGNPLSTLNWNVLYADSENLPESQTADRLFDNQETIIWQTATDSGATPYPHMVVIDLGEVVKIKGIRLLPRGDKIKTGMINEFKIYFRTEAFIY